MPLPAARESGKPTECPSTHMPLPAAFPACRARRFPGTYPQDHQYTDLAERSPPTTTTPLCGAASSTAQAPPPGSAAAANCHPSSVELRERGQGAERPPAGSSRPRPLRGGASAAPGPPVLLQPMRREQEAGSDH